MDNGVNNGIDHNENATHGIERQVRGVCNVVVLQTTRFHESAN